MRRRLALPVLGLLIGLSLCSGCNSAVRDGVSTGIEESVAAAIGAVTDAIVARLLDGADGAP